MAKLNGVDAVLFVTAMSDTVERLFKEDYLPVLERMTRDKYEQQLRGIVHDVLRRCSYCGCAAAPSCVQCGAPMPAREGF